ncbi:MAG: ATP synthase F1 subunit gamma [Myxococcales bacterium]|nr:ATP synthase F1 subunit gamma [Myxococcales bacterium]
MPSLKDIRKRVTSVKNTQKITRAMKLVAAAKLRRAQGAMMELRPYAEKYREMLSSLVDASGGAGDAAHPLLETREGHAHVAILAISSDRGMCGGFNSNIQKTVVHYAKTVAEEGREAIVFPLGRRMTQFVNKSDMNVGRELGEVIAGASTDSIKSITSVLVDGFLKGEFDDVVIISNRFDSIISQNPRVTDLLPVAAVTEDLEHAESVRGDYLYEPDQETLLNHVVPAFVEVQIREAILESIAGEHAARMNAMNSATDNATEMISALTLQLNRARQAAITTELMEIIGGAEALK